MQEKKAKQKKARFLRRREKRGDHRAGPTQKKGSTLGVKGEKESRQENPSVVLWQMKALGGQCERSVLRTQNWGCLFKTR